MEEFCQPDQANRFNTSTVHVRTAHTRHRNNLNFFPTYFGTFMCVEVVAVAIK